jgi:hypothetical protein
METHKKSGIVHGPLPSGEKIENNNNNNKKEHQNEALLYGPRGIEGEPAVPDPGAGDRISHYDEVVFARPHDQLHSCKSDDQPACACVPSWECVRA